MQFWCYFVSQHSEFFAINLCVASRVFIVVVVVVVVYFVIDSVRKLLDKSTYIQYYKYTEFLLYLFITFKISTAMHDAPNTIPLLKWFLKQLVQFTPKDF
jgi:hypothetical protein